MEPQRQSGPLPAAGQSGNRSLLVYLAYATGIALTLSLYYLVKDRVFAFSDIGIDLYSYYYPVQVIQAQQLRELHQLTWSFQLGLGGYIGSMFNPTQLVTAWLPQAWQLDVRLPTYFLKLILAGGFFFGYLRRIRFAPGLATIGALGLAFSGYSMINGQWDTQGLVILQLAAYLFFLESYFRGGSFWCAVAAGMTVGSGSAFDTYTFSLLSVLYFALRPAITGKHDDHRAFLPALAGFACFAALGFALTAAVQLPNMLYLLDSPRVSGGHAKFSSLLEQLSDLNSRDLIWAELAGLFGKGLLGTGSAYQGWSNWFEAPGFYVGMLPLLCLPQLLGPTATRRERLLCVAGGLLLALYIVWPAMRYSVYGFGHTGFRLSTLWVSVGLLVLGLAGLRRAWLSGIWRAGLLASASGIIGLLLVVAWHYSEVVVMHHVALVIGFTSVHCIVLWTCATGGRRAALPVLTCIFACELLLFAMPPLTQRTAVHADGSSSHGNYADGTRAALGLIRRNDPSPTFYRIEKTYESVFLNDALVQGYHGTKSYFFHGRGITRFVDKMQLPRRSPRTNYISSMAGRPHILDLLGVKYLLARNRKLDGSPGMVHVGRAGKIHVYENTDTHGIGHLYRQVIGEAAASNLSLAKRDALLLQQVVVEHPEAIRARLAQLDAQHADAQHADARIDADPQVRLRKLSDIHLQADVVAPRASVLLIAMPFDNGWEAEVDGAPVELLRADYGLTALLLAPGRHQVNLRYTVPGRPLGTWISLTALLILLAFGGWQLFTRRRARRG